MSSAQVEGTDNLIDGMAGQSVANGNQYLTFFCDQEEYGVDILRVQEIRGWSQATMIPNTPSYMRGVINIRGTIVPIIDLRERLCLDRQEYGRTTVVIVLRIEFEGRDRMVGIVVDAVSDVYNVTDAQMKPAPDFAAVGQIQFAKSLATVDEKMIIILEVDRLYDEPDGGGGAISA